MPPKDDRYAELLERVTAAETKLELYIEQSKDYAERIRLLEDKKNWLLGAIAVLTVIWPFISHKIGEALGFFAK